MKFLQNSYVRTMCQFILWMENLQGKLLMNEANIGHMIEYVGWCKIFKEPRWKVWYELKLEHN